MAGIILKSGGICRICRVLTQTTWNTSIGVGGFFGDGTILNGLLFISSDDGTIEQNKPYNGKVTNGLINISFGEGIASGNIISLLVWSIV